MRSSIGAFLLSGLLFLSVATITLAQGPSAENKPADAASAGLHPILVELFTSEGCSSCPPADALLEKLDEHQPIPGAQLIVLSEHVTYWDHDGWKDPNSSAQLTDRQTDYEHELGRETPYTPQLIVDGTTEPRLTSPQQIEDALLKAKDASMIPVRIGDVEIDPQNPTVLHAHIDAGENPDKHNADVYVAVALAHVESQVSKGENSGKHLTHVDVVQELAKVGKLPKGKSFAQDVQLKLKPGTDPKNVRLVAFVQEAGPGKLLGVAMHKPTS
jgi:hypothetical protein